MTSATFTTGLWPAPTSAALNATVTVPGSKSQTNRALVLAAQAGAESLIHGGLRSRDTDLMVDALRILGTGCAEHGDGSWTVTPGPLRGPAILDCGLAGTVMRFLPPLAATAHGDIRFDGDEQARRRPMSVILGALRAIGVDVDGDALPFTVHGAGTPAGGTVSVDASASSQFVSGLLLSGASYRDGLTVRHRGDPLPSMPHIRMTVQALRSVRVAVDDTGPDEWRVLPGPIGPWRTRIEPDLSNATPFLAAAAVASGTVRVPGWPVSTTQAGDAIRGILTDMGVSVALGPAGSDGSAELSVTGTGALAGIDVDLHEVGELTPTVTALALFADGPSRLRGIGHLRGHETDRLAALAGNIRALGGSVQESADELLVEPRQLHGGVWRSHADHRLATAGAIVGLRVQGVGVEDIGTTAKTMPGFAGMWFGMIGQAPGGGSSS